VAPAHEAVELGIGDATLIKALAEATGRSDQAVKELYQQHGDLGTVAQSCRSTQKTMFPGMIATLSIRGVFSSLREIAKTEGTKSTEKKKAVIKKLLVSARETEAGYIMRLLRGKLRIGLAQQTVVAALAHAARLQELAASGASLKDSNALAAQLAEADGILKQVFSECPSWYLIIPALLQHGVEKLPEACHFLPGVPVKPMLAKPTHGATLLEALARACHRITPRASAGIQEIMDRFADVEFSCEYKYDGERAQVSAMAVSSLLCSRALLPRSTCWTTATCASSRATRRTTRASTRTL